MPVGWDEMPQQQWWPAIINLSKLLQSKRVLSRTWMHVGWHEVQQHWWPPVWPVRRTSSVSVPDVSQLQLLSFAAAPLWRCPLIAPVIGCFLGLYAEHCTVRRLFDVVLNLPERDRLRRGKRRGTGVVKALASGSSV
jgi:hypothetical protein